MKMIERVHAHSEEISWAEREAILQHCLWSQDQGQLVAWLNDTPDDVVTIHIAGLEQTPVVLDVDPDGPIAITQGESVQQALGLPDERIEYRLTLSKADAIRILHDRHAIPDDRVRDAFRVYADFVEPRIKGQPFVHLRIQNRSLPIQVPFL